MKKGIMVSIILMIILSSCKSTVKHDAYSQIYKRYNMMESYVATATLTVTNNKMKNDYKIKQYYSAPDNYRMDILNDDGGIFVSYIVRDKECDLLSPSGDKTSLDLSIVNERDYIFLPEFFRDYFSSQDSTAETASGFSGELTKLDIFLKNSDSKRFRQSLLIDNKTYVPSKLITYDVNDKEVVCVTFENFILGEKVEDAVFNKGDNDGSGEKGMGRD